MHKVEKNSIQSEIQRIRKLNDFDLDYLELQEEVKNLVELVGIVAGTEISMLNFIDNHSQWSISAISAHPSTKPREDSVCNYTINSTIPVEIPRLDLDERFSDWDFIKGPKGLKYYLGIPLSINSGENIGVLCMVDKGEKNLSENKKKALSLIAAEIVEKLEAKKRTEETLFALSEASRVKNQVAHDVRGPIHGIAGLAEVVESEDLSPEEMKEYFKLIKDSGKGLLELTDEILSNGKTGKLFKPNQINLSELREKLYRLYQLPARSKNIEFQIHLDPEKDRHFFSKRKLLPIIGNLISNSIKFTGSQGKVDIDLEIVNSEHGKLLSITVTDSGIGFSEDAMQDYFNDELTSSLGIQGEKGFGLGLKLVHEMVAELRGKMHISSEQGKGAKIEVRLPLR